MMTTTMTMMSGPLCRPPPQSCPLPSHHLRLLVVLAVAVVVAVVEVGVGVPLAVALVVSAARPPAAAPWPATSLPTTTTTTTTVPVPRSALALVRCAPPTPPTLPPSRAPHPTSLPPTSPSPPRDSPWLGYGHSSLRLEPSSVRLRRRRLRCLLYRVRRPPRPCARAGLRRLRPAMHPQVRRLLRCMEALLRPLLPLSTPAQPPNGVYVRAVVYVHTLVGCTMMYVHIHGRVAEALRPPYLLRSAPPPRACARA